MLWLTQAPLDGPRKQDKQKLHPWKQCGVSCHHIVYLRQCSLGAESCEAANISMPLEPLKLQRSEISMIFFQLFKQHCQENGKIKLAGLCFQYLLKASNPELSRVTLLSAPCAGHCIILRYKATSLVSLTFPTTGHSSGQPGIEGRGQSTAGGLQVCHRSKSSIFMWDDSTSEHHSPSGCASYHRIFSPSFSLSSPKFPTHTQMENTPTHFEHHPSQAFLFQLPDCQPQHSRAAHL